MSPPPTFACLLLLVCGLVQDAQPNRLVADIAPRPTRPPREGTTTKEPSKPASYWITYGKTIRPGHPLDLQVQIVQGRQPVMVKAVLKSPKGVEVVSVGPVSVFPSILESIILDIPVDIDTEKHDFYYYSPPYTLEVSGKGNEVSFRDVGEVSLQKKSFSIFVQTDKAIYKPSQRVQFRTLAMTPDMKVLKDVKQDIEVFDAKGNRILQYKAVTAPENLGVVEKSFKLASSVPTGDWKIVVKVMGNEETKEFEVSDYVLPRFEVDIDASSYAVSDDALYGFKVKSKYTFGKPVAEGLVHVTMNYDRWGQRDPNKGLRRKGMLNSDGELKFQVTILELLQLVQDEYPTRELTWQRFVITANVTEKRTGRTQSTTHNFKFYPTPVKMKFLEITPNSFKSGLDFTAYLELTKQDDSHFSPIEAKSINVMINVTYNVPLPRPPTTTTTTTLPPKTDKNGTGIIEELIPFRPHSGDYWYPREMTKNLTLDKHTYQLPESGWIVVTFRVPEEALSISLKATTISPFPEATDSYYASQSRSPTDSFLQLSTVNKKPKVGDTMQVNVKSTDKMRALSYQILSKGLLVLSNQVLIPGTATGYSTSFSFKVTRSMSPSVTILAFYVKDDGEFVVDALSLSVEGLFDKAVSVEFSKKKVQPGENVEVIVKGQPDSVVFLLAVDKSVKLLKSGNDITQDLVREELASYDHGNYGNWRYMFICGWPSYIGGTDARTVFQNAGVGVMTDGTVYNRYDDESERDTKDNNFGGGAITAPLPAGGSDDLERKNSDKQYMEGPTRTRKFFPENWIWEIKIISPNSQGEVVIPKVAPDTITSWIATAFSANPNTGLSVAEAPAEVITFRDLFVSLDLPSSIVRNEDFCFAASVFNYYPQEIPVLLTMDPSPDFSNMWAKSENGKIKIEKESLYYSHFVGFMRENEVKSLTFCFTPTKIGTIVLSVSAKTDVAGLSDRVERKLRVKPEGIPRSTTFPYLVEPTNGKWTEDVVIQLPRDTVIGSERISVNVAGNLLGPIFDNLEDLLKKPYGCGEQNMINFAPIMSLLDFFFTTNTITDDIRDMGVEYMTIGYQKELLYEHNTTGGYSTFGNRKTDENPSMWLTAFVTKCFAQAETLDRKYQRMLPIDTNLIKRSAMWMLTQQVRNGSFVESGRVFNKRLQGGSAKGVALTAYTVIALQHVMKLADSFDERTVVNIKRGTAIAVAYLEKEIPNLDDIYDVCITAYALHLFGSILSDTIFEKMENMAVKGSGMVYWARPQVKKLNNYWWSRNSDAINIEATAYALLTYSMRGVGTEDGLPVLRWLSKQKGENGGFISTQDTVIGIEALTTVAKKLHGAEFVPMTVEVTSSFAGATQSNTIQFEVTKDTEMTLQRKDIPYQAGGKMQLVATAAGTGNANISTVLVDVVFNYNVELETKSSTYDMNHTLITDKEGFILHFNVWTVDGSSASMTILEVEIPAGFSPDYETIQKENQNVSKIDDNGEYLNVYINTDVIAGHPGIKLVVPMVQTGGALTKAKGKSYKVYNYYEPEIELTKTYHLVESDFCTKVPEMEICQYF